MGKGQVSVEKLMRLYSLGKIDFCEMTEKFLDLLTEGKFGFAGEYLKLLKKASGDKILHCFNEIIDLLFEMDNNFFLRGVLTLASKIGLENTKRLLGDYLEQSDSAIISLETKLQEIDRLKEIKELIVVFNLFKKYIPKEKLRLIEIEIKKRGIPFSQCMELDEGRPILNAMGILELVFNEVKESLRKKDLDAISYNFLLLQKILNVDYERKKIIQNALRAISNDELEQLLSNTLHFAFQKDVLDVIIWLLPLTEYEDCVNQILKISDLMIQNGLLVNYDFVSDSVMNCKNVKIDVLIEKINRLKMNIDWKKRLLAVNLFGEILKRGYDEVISQLAKMCRDKRSIIRKAAASHLIDYLERKYRFDLEVPIAIIKSNWTDGIARLLEIFTHRECDKTLLETLIKSSVRIPKSRIMESLLNLIEMKWREISLTDVIESLQLILKFSWKKKRMAERTVNLLKTILREVDFSEREWILKYMRKKGVPQDVIRSLR